MTQPAISDALIISEKRPRRPLFSFFVNHYTTLLGLFITLIMAISAWPYAPGWTLIWVILYWLYNLTKGFLRGRNIWGVPYQSKYIQFSRSIVVVICVSIFVGHLYLNTDYLRERQGVDSLWLLLLLGIFITSQYGITELMLITMVCACLSLIFLYWLITPVWTQALVLGLTVKLLWLMLLAFILHIMLRYLSDWNANVKLLRGVEKQIIQIRAISDERLLLETVVIRISAEFEYNHVNIFYLLPDGNLKCMAGACTGGRMLAQNGFILERDRGIIGHVVQNGKAYYTNNVGQDPFYQPHPTFPKTKAELAVPIKLQEEIIGVLDIQVHHPGVFFPQDIEIMEIMASLFSGVLDDIRLLWSRQQTNKIIEAIAGRILSQHELESTLSQIAQVAHEELKADVVVLYERNPQTNEITGPTHAGHLYQPDFFNLTVLEQDSLVYRLLAAADDYRFHEDVKSLVGDPLFMPTAFHKQRNIPTFDEREKIESRAIICLRTGTDRVGLLFLNFRLRRTFDDQEKETIFKFANLAALAIQKAQSHQQEIQFERKTLAAHLHDQLIATTDGLSRLVSATLSDPLLIEAHHSNLTIAFDAVQELRRDLQYLGETLKDLPVGNLRQEVEKIVQRAESAYGVAFNIQWSGYAHRVPSAIAVQLKFILNEAILNAIKHGKASRIDLTFDITDSHITTIIADNGQGFDPARVKWGGLANMEARVKKIQGYYQADSTPGQGTRIFVQAPYHSTVGDTGNGTSSKT